MFSYNRRLKRHTCTLCGREIPSGSQYWYLNGSSVCSACLEDFARRELAPYRLVRGEEGRP